MPPLTSFYCPGSNPGSTLHLLLCLCSVILFHLHQYGYINILFNRSLYNNIHMYFVAQIIPPLAIGLSQVGSCTLSPWPICFALPYFCDIARSYSSACILLRQSKYFSREEVPVCFVGESSVEPRSRCVGCAHFYWGVIGQSMEM